MSEVPIFLGYIEEDDHYSFDKSDASVEERRPIPGCEVWLDLDAIPAVPPPQTPYPGTVSGAVSGISGVVLTVVPDNPRRLQSLTGQLANIVPANYRCGKYQPTLCDASGTVITYNPAVWVADGVRKEIEFKRSTPSNPPYTFSYWMYVGAFPTAEEASNIGTGAEVLSPPLQFRTLTAGYGIEITQNADTIEFAATVVGANEGAGAEVFDAASSNPLQFRTLIAGSGVEITQNANTIEFAATVVGANEGTGAEVFDAASSNPLQFRTLIAGSGVEITQNPDTIEFAATVVGANEGTGAEVFDTASGNSLQFRTLTAGSGVEITQNADTIEFTAAVVGANEGAGAEVFDTASGNSLQFRTLIAGSGVEITQNADTIELSAVVVGANEGNGAEVFDAASGNPLQFRTLTAGSGVEITQNADTIELSAAIAGANVGAGAEVFDVASGNPMQFRTLTAGSGVEITQNADTIEFTATVAGANVGAGAEVFDAASGNPMQFRTLIAGSGIEITQNADTIELSAAIAGANEGTGAEVFDAASGNPMQFRTLVATSGLSVTQSVSAVTFAADESTVPANLALFVSAAGNDSSGDGTRVAPYLTLVRALEDVRVLGYDSSATVTIVSNGGPYALSAGTLALNLGSRGQRVQALTIQGDSRNTVGSAVVSAVVQDAASGLLDISAAAPPGQPFALGQIIHFTSGVLASFTTSPALAPAAVECFIAAVISPTVIRIPFAAAMPAPGDTFDIGTLASTVIIGSSLALRGAPVIWSNLKIQLAASLSSPGCGMQFSGVWFVVGATSTIRGRFRAGVSPAAAYTALGVYIDNTSAGPTLAVAGDSAAFANSVFGGDGVTTANLTVTGADTLTECYAAGAGSFSAKSVSNVWLDNCMPATSSGSLEIASMTSTVSNVKINGSSQYGLHVTLGGTLVANNVTLGGCSVGALVCDQAAAAITTALTFAASPGCGIIVDTGGRLTDTGAIVVANASTDDDGILVINGGSLVAAALTSSGNQGVGVLVNGEMRVAGAISCGGNQDDGISTDRAFLSAGSLVLDNNGGSGLAGNNQSTIICGGNFTATGNADSAITAANETRISVAGAVNCAGSGDQGIDCSGASFLSLGALSATDNAQNGVLLRGGSALFLSSTALLSANGVSGLDIAASNCGGADVLSAVSNGGHGIVAVNAALNFAAAVVANLNGGNGIITSQYTTVNCGDTITAGSNGAAGALFTDSDVVATGGAFQGNIGGSGVVFLRATARFSAGFTSALNRAPPQIALAGRSCVSVAGAVSDTSGSPGVSVSLTDASVLMAGSITVANNADSSLSAVNGSRVIVSGAVTLSASGSGTAAAFISESSHLRAGTVSVTESAGTGIVLMRGSQLESPNSINCSGNGNGGLLISDGSIAVLGGAVCSVNQNGPGISVTNGSFIRSFGAIDCGRNAADGLSLFFGSAGAALSLLSSAGGNAGFGTEVRKGSRLQTVAGNTMSGASGAVVVGLNATVAWTMIDTKNPAMVTDYLSGQTTTEFCTVLTF